MSRTPMDPFDAEIVSGSMQQRIANQYAYEIAIARIVTLEAALRNECVGHMDDCRCRSCVLVFAPSQAPDAPKETT